MFVSRVAVAAAGLFLTSCAALNFYHDPESGLINRAQVPPLLQSVRCELVTFFDVNQSRYNVYQDMKAKRFGPTAKGSPELKQRYYVEAVTNYSYFPLDPNQLSSAFLDLKVVDSLSIPSGSSATTINATFLSNGGVDKRTWHVGPTVADTNTYELNWPFVVSQSATLDLSHREGRTGITANGYYPCYRDLPPRFALDAVGTKEALARHAYPEVENFTRIYVDGTEPLAGWLMDRSAQLDTTLFPDRVIDFDQGSPPDERMYPAQMIYTFTVQFGFGADASLSLITAKWNPIGIDVAGSTQQTSMLTLYINGYDAANANAAKSGITGAVAPQAPRHGLAPAAPFSGPFVVPAQPNCPSRDVCSQHFLKYPLPINPP